MTRRRLDAEVARRGLARSREQAQQLIAAGQVRVNGTIAEKPATQVDSAAAIIVDSESEQARYVSRGAHKLIGALDAFAGLQVAGRDALDAGASTGGFTQVLLERGVRRVLAVDVGYGQLAWSLRTDDRVIAMDRTNIRLLAADDLPFAPDLVVADLSFISLELVLPQLLACTAAQCDYLLMVKPQFEVGRHAVGDGVVRDPDLRAGAVRAVAAAAVGLGLAVRGVVASPLPGPSGNVEYFLWLARGDSVAGLDSVEEAIDRAVREGPQ